MKFHYLFSPLLLNASAHIGEKVSPIQTRLYIYLVLGAEKNPSPNVF